MFKALENDLNQIAIAIYKHKCLNQQVLQVQNKALQKLIQYYHLELCDESTPCSNVHIWLKLIELFTALLQQGNINP